MRCPKCGYISFDRLNNCDKCGKDISAASASLNGVISDVRPPFFLEAVVGSLLEEPDMIDETVKLDTGAAVSYESEKLGSVNQTLDFDLDNDTVDAVDLEEEEDFAMSLEGPELGQSDEISLAKTMPEELGGESFGVGIEDALELEGIGEDHVQDLESMTEKDSGPKLDFDDIDLSDLAPPAEKKKNEDKADSMIADHGIGDEIEDLPISEKAEVEKTKTDSKHDDSEEDFLVEEELEASEAGEETTGLEDLFIDDIDLETTIPPPTTKSETPQTRKTGTALDGFDVDLGELIPEKKE